jgi:pSer/pThr/pTyr-binding forkhead associated (FHA) protein
MQKIRLVWADPSTAEEQERTLTLPVSLGRSPENSLVLESTVVSGKHATISFDAGTLTVHDLNSRNGVWVNSRRVEQRAPLELDDTIQIGPYLFVVRPDTGDVRVKLTWTDLQGQQRVALQPLPFVLGRDPASSQVVVDDPEHQISRRHAEFTLVQGQVQITDLNSRNGFKVDGEPTTQATLADGAVIEAGPFRFTLAIESAARRRAAGEATIIFSDQDDKPTTNLEQPAQPARTSDWPPPLFDQPLVPVRELERLGVPVHTVDYATVGGGLGSFVWVDHLLIYGVKPEQVAAVGIDDVPYKRYQRLCRNSQIPPHERLRSNSESCPDNIWGWPGYAEREIWHDMLRGHIATATRTLLQIMGEPILAQTYTPRAGDVFRSIDREMQRIGWAQMVRRGRVKAIRKTDDERYVIAYAPAGPGPAGRGLVVARYIHIATGYPAIRFLPHLQRYREATGDFKAVVNAYENHDAIYEYLQANGGLVILQGRGIVASRLIQRIYEARQVNPNIFLIHLMRSPTPEGHRFGRAQRSVTNHIETQPFNWPRACWGGELRVVLERAAPEERKQLLDDWGGTTTADRRDWQRITTDGLREGWYQIVFGEISGEVRRTPEGLLEVDVLSRHMAGGTSQFRVNYIIDATGLEAKVNANPLLQDLIATYGLEENPMGRLHVANDFEIPGLRNGAGRAYAAGAITLGGPHAAVDSFLGLQYCALRAVDALAAARAPGLRKLGTIGSTIQWLKWAQGVKP